MSSTPPDAGFSESEPAPGHDELPIVILAKGSPVQQPAADGDSGPTSAGVAVSAFGGPLSVLHFRVPALEQGQIRIKVAGAGVGLWDLIERSGVLGPLLSAPRALGWEASGTVVEVGPGVNRFAVGDRVVTYRPMTGLQSDLAVAREDDTVQAPKTVPLHHAGALLISGAAAHLALADTAQVRAGQTVLITAGAGGTGTYAVELAKHLGAHVVATAGPANLDFARELGADEVYDYHGDAVAEIRQAHPDGVDVMMDNVSADNFSAYAPLVRSGGWAISTHEPLGTAPDGVKTELIISWEQRAAYEQVVKLVDDGVLTVRIGAEFPFDRASAAYDLVESRHGRGRVLLVP